ncbi:MAG TPA: cardiolipin synthase, partial [Rhodobacteraceae bacterium]|nr:cardiolipin synthase [Paracoccaceae bacterium]
MSFWVGVSSAAIFLLYATAVVFAVRAASTARTPQGAVGWVIFLILNPVLAIPSYLFLGHHRFRGYRIARQESERVVEALRLA